MSPPLRWLLAVGALLLALLALSQWHGGAVRPPDTTDPASPQRASTAAPPTPPAADDDTAASLPQRTEAPPPIPRDGVLVHTVDGADRGVADVPVKLIWFLPGTPGEQRLAFARTDAAGYAALVGEEETRRRLREAGLDVEFTVVADIPSPTPPRAVLGAQPTAAEVVTLRLPDAGTVVVRVLDAMGQPIDDGGDVFLFWREPGSNARWDRIGTPRAPSRGGTAQLGIVPLHKQLLLRASGTGTLQSGEAIVAGPMHAAEVVTAELRLGLPWAIVTGRLVDETGAVIQSDRLLVGLGTVALDAEATAAPPAAQTSLGWQKLDERGRFRLRAPQEAPPGKRFALVAEDRATTREGVRRAVVALPAALASGAEFDVGDVVLQGPAERLLCSGRVLDDTGAPVALADVTAGYWDKDLGRWVSLHRQRVRCDPDGRFEIRTAQPAPAQFSLSAAATGRVRAKLEISEGAADLLLVLARGGSLQALIKAPTGVPAHFLVGALVDADGNRREPDQFAGRFLVEGLAPGSYDVVVRIAGSPWELLRIAAIDVVAGQQAADPRLSPIDVGDRCRALRLLLVDGQHRPRANLRLSLVDAQGHGVETRTDREGHAFVVVPRGPVGFALLADDGRRIAVMAQDEEQTIVLP